MVLEDFRSPDHGWRGDCWLVRAQNPPAAPLLLLWGQLWRCLLPQVLQPIFWEAAGASISPQKTTGAASSNLKNRLFQTSQIKIHPSHSTLPPLLSTAQNPSARSPRSPPSTPPRPRAAPPPPRAPHARRRCRCWRWPARAAGASRRWGGPETRAGGPRRWKRLETEWKAGENRVKTRERGWWLEAKCL